MIASARDPASKISQRLSRTNGRLRSRARCRAVSKRTPCLIIQTMKENVNLTRTTESLMASIGDCEIYPAVSSISTISLCFWGTFSLSSARSELPSLFSEHIRVASLFADQAVLPMHSEGLSCHQWPILRQHVLPSTDDYRGAVHSEESA